MEHKGTVTLETERLILRRFTPADAQAMYDNWAGDPEATKFLTWKTYESVEDANETLAFWEKEYEKKDYYQWAIELKSLGQPIGSIAAVFHDDAVQLVHVGYCIGKAWWRKGITSEALKTVMDFFFDEVGANRVEARHDANNPNSGRVMVKCGMQYEGMLRQSGRNNQGICDLCWYGMLASDRKAKIG